VILHLNYMFRLGSVRRRSGFVLALCAVVALPVGGATGSATQSLSASINPIGALTVPASASLSPGTIAFQPFTGNLTLNYELRTTPTGGGTIGLIVSSDFSPSGGPSIASGALAYSCSGASLGTACSGTQTVSTTTQTPVLTLPASACTGGGGACSNQDPNSVNLNFKLTDDPGYATGTYSAQITFVISAT
jgi:hypothetical protein